MNKVVLVTGSSRSIGKEIIKQFAKNNYNVVINYNNSKESALKLETEIKKYNIDYLVIKCDISNEEEVKYMYEQVVSKFHRLDILINNASISIDTIFEEKTKKNFEKILSVNLIGTFLISKYFGQYMYENKTGKIINITSTNAIDTNYPMSLDYDASKSGVISLTHNLAKQFAPYVTVNAIALGWVDTDMNKEMDPEFKEEEIKKILLKRFATPKEIAEIVYYLGTEANYINDSIIRVDGGSK